MAALEGNTDGIYANGLHVAGERFVVTNAQDRSIYARKVGLASAGHLH